MNQVYKTLITIIVSFGVGFVLLLLVFSHQQKKYRITCEETGISIEQCSLIKKIGADMAGADKGILFLILILFMISCWSRAVRWNLLLEPISHKPRMINSLGSIMAAYLANLGVPRTGELVRAGLLSRNENIPVQKVLGTIFTDRVLDVLSLGVAILLAFFFSFQSMKAYFIPEKGFLFYLENGAALYWGIGLASLIVVGLGFMWYLKKSSWWNESLPGQKIRSLFSGFMDGLASIRHIRNPVSFFLHSINIWFMYFLMTYIGFFAMDATSHLNVEAGLLTFVFGALGVLIPTPGGMGSYQYFVSEALTIYEILPADAFSFANMLFFTVQIFCNVIFGFLAFIFLPAFNKGKI